LYDARLYSGVQTDDQATILEQKKDSAQTKGVPVCNAIFKDNVTTHSPMDKVNKIKMSCAGI
jgi:hypothetical protein